MKGRIYMYIGNESTLNDGILKKKKEKKRKK